MIFVILLDALLNAHVLLVDRHTIVVAAHVYVKSIRKQ